MPPPTPPYTSIPYADLHKIWSRVPSADIRYFKSLFPFSRGLLDTCLATLFSNLIHELHSAGLDSANDDHRAWYSTHPTYDILTRLLLSLGDATREAGARHVERGVSGVCEAVLGDAIVGSDPQGRPVRRGYCPRCGEETQEGEEEGQRAAGDRPIEPTPLEQLRKLGIL